MASNIDLFNHPEMIAGAKALVANLQRQIAIVEPFERLRTYLQKGDLTSRVLDKCKPFTAAVQECDRKGEFYLEITKLSIDELLFCTASFSEPKLRIIQPFLQAAQVRAYMLKWDIKLSQRARKQILTRLETYSQYGNALWELIRLEKPEGSNEPKPTSVAQSKSGRWSFDGAPWENVTNFISPTIIDGLLSRPYPYKKGLMSENIRGRIPDAYEGGDAVMNIDIKETEWLRRLFPGSGVGAVVGEIEPIFGPRFGGAIERSQLREWEKQNGFIDRTNCVKLVHVIQLRLEYDAAFGICNDLYSGYSG